MSIHTRSFSIKVPFLLLVILLLLTAANPYVTTVKSARLTVGSIEFLGMVEFETGIQFSGTEVGGLSSIDYDENRGVYYIISDDPSQINPARYYTASIDVFDGGLDPGDVTFQQVTFLRDETGSTFPPLSLDPEGLTLPHPGQLFITSEGFVLPEPPIDPFINRFNLVGRQNRALTVPEKFLPNPERTQGIRHNLAFESLTSTPDERYLYTATENALVQDGPPATLTNGSPARVLQYDLGSKRPGAEFVYPVDPIFAAPVPPDAFAVNGLVELLALDNRGTFLAMERSFSVGVGNRVALYETTTEDATNVADIQALAPSGGSPASYQAMSKEFLLDFQDEFGLIPDNLEGLAFGPPLADGRSLLIVVSDNNFAVGQTTQFIALAVELVPVSD
jgi:3-phytase/alkaline phosphatase D